MGVGQCRGKKEDASRLATAAMVSRLFLFMGSESFREDVDTVLNRMTQGWSCEEVNYLNDVYLLFRLLIAR
ncbi:hypothetical protein DPU24_16275 [Salmonella enterica subsp. enterica serovar Oranienburg]|nr:hypothetical protein [Salmonella enterica subsp. enterica serovar Oranienburg]